MHDWELRVDLLKSERMGTGVDNKEDSEEGSNSPKRHWPQKAMVAQAAIALSRGDFNYK